MMGVTRLLPIAVGILLSLAIPHSGFTQADEDEAPVQPNKYRKSRLTNDASEAVSDRRRLLLNKGEDKAVDLDFDTALESKFISIGDPTIVLPQLVKVGEKKQIVFKPLKEGETTVTVRDQDGVMRVIFTVRVTKHPLLRRTSEIRSLVRDIEGLDIRIVGNKIVIEGEVLVPADYARLLIVEKEYGDVALNMATMSPIAMQVLSKRIQEDINAFAPNVKTRVVNGMIFLEGTVDNDGQAQRAVKVANLYMPEAIPTSLIVKVDQNAKVDLKRQLIVSFIVVNPPPPKKQEKLVRITVHFVELSKDYNRLFGFKWEPGFTADPQITIGQQQGGAAGASGVSFAATLSSLVPKLMSAQSAGYARILKTGTVIVRSGQPASLVDETGIPFITQGQNGQPMGATANVGLNVGVTPQILGQSEDIQLELKMKQTNLIGRAPAGGAAPITATHRVDTRIYVKSGESAAVAGVNSSDVGTEFNKDDPKPGGFEGGTDPLFTLMRSKAYRKKKSQFVIFVTPQIIENASDGTDDMKKNFRVKVK